MCQDKTYNGWTNYATWRVQLEVVSDLVEMMTADGETFEDRYAVKESLKERVEEIVSGEDYDQESLATQYAMAFLSDVNWYELADHAIEDGVLLEGDFND